MGIKDKYKGVRPIGSKPTLVENSSSLSLLKKNTKTFPVFSQMCLPGGPKSATYDPDTYVYPESYNLTDGLQPSILAIEGDTQVGVNNYSAENTDPNHNRSSKPFHHTVTEKAFYTELDNTISRHNPGTPFIHGVHDTQKTFLRVDLTEDSKVFRHTGVIVKGSVHCVNQRPRRLTNSPLGPRTNTFGLYDFEFYYLCNPLTSHTTGLDYSNSEGRLATLSTCYFYLRNRADSEEGTLFAESDLAFVPPIVTGQVSPKFNWAEFALQSETGTPSGHITLTNQIMRQYSYSINEMVTPVSAKLTTDANDKFDLNFVNFKLALPTFNAPIPDIKFKRFAVKGTYLLI
jgi:hypothetical protein